MSVHSDESERLGKGKNFLSGIHPEFSFPVIPDMFTYPERCPPALSVYVLTHPDP